MNKQTHTIWNSVSELMLSRRQNMNSGLRGVDSEGWAACGLGSARFIRQKGHNSYISNINFKEFAAWKGSSVDQGLLDCKHPNICSFP
jgi:hypothetical protein